MNRRLLVVVSAAVWATVSQWSYGQTPPYHANVLGISDGRTNIQVEIPTGLNRWGQVIGTYGGGLSGGTHAVLWTPPSANDGSGSGISGAGTLFAVETSTGLPPGTAGSTPTGLNDRGEIVGLAYTPGTGDGNQNQSWLWRPAKLNGLGGNFHCCSGRAVTFSQVAISGLGSLAEYNGHINNAGTIAAYGIYSHPLLWTPASPNSLTGSWSAEVVHSAPPADINDAGQIAGGSCEPQNWNGPYLHNGAFPLLDSDPIHSSLWLPPGSPECVGGAAGINRHGHLAISAVAADGSNIFAYVYKNGAATDVSTGLPSNAFALNNYDQIVGATFTDTSRAVLFEEGRAVDLNTVNDSTGGLFLKTAIAINDSGQILCNGVYPGSLATVLLTPNALVVSPITVSEGTIQHSGSTYTQTVTVTNGGSTALTAPISLALEGLTPGVTLTNANGRTFYVAAGSPFSTIGTSDLAPGATTPAFTLVFANPGHLAISYTARVLAGDAPR